MARKKGEKIPILEEQEEIRRILREYEKPEDYVRPVEDRFSLDSKEYIEFEKERKEALKPHTFFEKACKFSGKHLRVGIKKEDAEKLNEVLYFIGYNIEAKDVISLSILTFILCLALSGIFMLISFGFALVFLLTGIFLLFIIQKYPLYREKVETMETLNTMPLAITYMVIYMRSSPTLEGAVRFASKHLTGPLARDLRGLVWNLESGVYLSMDSALKDYAAKWHDKNKHFSSAIEILRNSQKVANESERLKTLDEATDTILKGNLSMMQSFARSLRMPIVVLYMLCIVLPVMGLVIAPVLTTLMAQGLSANMLIIVYNILLPLIIYVMIKMILSKRPGSFSKPDIRGYPGLPSPGHLMLGKGGKELPLLPISIILFIVISIPGFLLFLTPQPGGYSFSKVLMSMCFVWAGVVSISVYALGSSYQKLKIRKELEELEEGLDVGLFQLGDRLAMGIPIERAVADSASSLKKGAIKGLFTSVNTNLEEAGMPFEKALFDERVGALRYYPSKLVKTLMEVLVESARKGLKAAADSMETIATYLGNLKTVKESMEELIGKTVSAMKFQAQFLTSFIAGVIIALDVLLFKILSELGMHIGELELPSEVTTASVTSVFKNSMFNVASIVPAEHMQLIVGVYMIEVTLLLSMLINGVKNGKDDIYRNYAIGTNLIMSTLVYTVAVLFGIMLFTSFRIGV